MCPEDKPEEKSREKRKLPMPPVEQAAGAQASLEPAPSAALPDNFPIVGIGASAGGLAAFESFFSGMPTAEDPGMAFVLVQHLAPDHKSILCELVRRYTRLQVFEVVDGMEIHPNCAYIIPPNYDMALLKGRLQLLEPSAPRGMRLPIDFFFRSLAHERGERAICIVLSGSGSDGTQGLRAIKGEGGLVLAQDPDTADYDGMPRSAIATGLVDNVLPPPQMPAQLIAYARHAFGERSRHNQATYPMDENTLNKIIIMLRNQIGHDFSCYKQNTLVRRIERRMSVHQIETQENYLRFLQQTPAEAQFLFRDMLIGVTSFFRDPEAFSVMEKDMAKMLSGKPAGAPVRVWVCGCSTGEEAYSIAILLQEQLDLLNRFLMLQVFATDLDSESINQARAAVFPSSIAADISSERLERFFVHEPGSDTYRVKKTLRDLLVFSDQNVLKDPAFSRLDLITCRNLLIYLTGEAQDKLITLFHYALNPGGMLLLGPSEAVDDSLSLFKPANRKWKLYRRDDSRVSKFRPLPGNVKPARFTLNQLEPPAKEQIQMPAQTDSGLLVEQTLLEHYAQASVLIDSGGEILHIYGRTGNYLEPSAGNAGMNILAMAREGLQRPLANALHKVVSRKEPVYCPGIKVRTNGSSVMVNLILRPANHKGSIQFNRFLVILETAPEQDLSVPGEVTVAGLSSASAPGDRDDYIEDMEKRLREKEEYLQVVFEEMQTSNEEFKSANEELQSINEELQSTNEELETSKEELQSVNEELTTVNAELQNNVVNLCRANNDMNNVLAGTGVATLFVDIRLRIVRFTPTATQMINLIPTDVGRPVSHLVSNLVDYNRLVEDIQAVLDDLIPREVEVKTPDGKWFLMRIRPYRTLDNVIEGAVVFFVDITELKHSRDASRAAQLVSEMVVNMLPDPTLVLSADLCLISASQAFYSKFDNDPLKSKGKNLFALGDGQLDIPALHGLIEDSLTENNTISEVQITHDFKRIGRRRLHLTARRLRYPSDQPEIILLFMEDLTDRPPSALSSNSTKTTD